MSHLATRLILAATTAVALGLSCTACLAPTSLSADTSRTSASLDHAIFQKHDTDYDLIRLEPHNARPPAMAALAQTQATGYQYQAQSQSPRRSFTSSHPLGEVSGIDLAVAGFAKSIEPTPYRQISPLDLDLREEDRRRIDAGYTLYANSADTGLGLDVALSPRVTFDRTENFSSTRAGAEVRIGQDLDLRGKPKKNSSWYLFAGADGEAVVWDVQRAGSLGMTDGLVTLQDKVTVGDVQAGVAWESPAGQMSISYIEREYEYRNGAIARTGEEDFVALTLTWRR